MYMYVCLYVYTYMAVSIGVSFLWVSSPIGVFGFKALYYVYIHKVRCCQNQETMHIYIHVYAYTYVHAYVYIEKYGYIETNH